MKFASDNWAGATDAVMAAVMRANGGTAPAYGNDPVSEAATAAFRRVFETDLEVQFTATGTAANALSLAAASVPGGLAFCSAEAHVDNDEFGATEFLSGGMKLVPVDCMAGRMDPSALAAALARYPAGGRFGHPRILTITQATECGTVYPIEQLRELVAIAKAAGLFVHMDGARFGNAVAALGLAPAEITWRLGIDLMSFGGTKNGCLGAEAILVFRPGLFPYLSTLRQRTGHVVSKARFVAAQFLGYFEDDGWLASAGHANAMAARLSAGLARSGRARLGWHSDANEVFPILKKSDIARLRAAGASLYEWDAASLPPNTVLAPDEDLTRLVTSFSTTEADVDTFLAVLEG